MSKDDGQMGFPTEHSSSRQKRIMRKLSSKRGRLKQDKRLLAEREHAVRLAKEDPDHLEEGETLHGLQAAAARIRRRIGSTEIEIPFLEAEAYGDWRPEAPPDIDRSEKISRQRG